MTEHQPDRIQAPLRDELARDRTRLANERTALAYVRTAIMLAVSGVTVLKFFSEYPWAVVAGWVLIALAVLNVAIGNVRYLATRRALRRGHEGGD